MAKSQLKYEISLTIMQMVQQDLSRYQIDHWCLKLYLSTFFCRRRHNVTRFQTRIHVQCIPLLPGVQYEGMPIIKEIGPIALDSQTQQEAQQLLSAAKTTFSVEIMRSQNIQSIQQKNKFDALLKINGSTMQIATKKFGGEVKQLIKINIQDNFPQITINRSDSRQLLMILDSESRAVTVSFSDHQIRDVFLLLIKLIIGNQYLQEKELNGKKTNEKQQENSQKIESFSSPVKGGQNLSNRGQSPIKVSSTSDLINLGDLKKQIKHLQEQKNQINKKYIQEKDQREYIQNKLKEAQQRLQSLNKNYFQLQKLNNQKNNQDNSEKEQLAFYRLQYQTLKAQNQSQQYYIQQLNKQTVKIKQELQYYKDLQKKHSYDQILIRLQRTQKQNEQLKAINSFFKQENQKQQIQIRNYEIQFQKIRAEQNHLAKKYQSLLSEKSIFVSSPILLSPMKSHMSQRQSDALSKVSKNSQEQFQRQNQKQRVRARQAELLLLKNQIRELVNENDYLRTMNSPQKKQSSKTQLKMELLEMKKIVNRLTQTVTEKDMTLGELKKVNKQLTNKINENAQIFIPSSPKRPNSEF